ncbi:MULTISPECIES: YncE family protein [unclassified Methylobacterium]|jgi:YVTN family beta-propeller protein|uniref:YncE family protein n=1 Tax=unclassified Methylobacterium TaxID=2615210 RepID=UPI001353501D|nr:YncE family protein [Methylobacterium sp. 2A]MWV22216.1 YncE family protein [Methylobacterium sp. 2A]
MIGCVRLFGLLVLLAAWPAAGGGLFVVSQQGAKVTRIEVGGATTATLVAAAPAVVAADAAGRLYLSHPDRRVVSVVAPDGSVRSLPLKAQPFGLAAEPDGSRIYVGDWSGNRVIALAMDGAVAGEAATGPDPAHLVLGPAGRLYVAEREGRSVGVIDTVAMRRVGSFPVGDGPFALAYDPARGRLYVANVRSNDVTVIDTQAGRILATVPAGASPYGIAVTADGARVLVSDQHAGKVSVIDAKTLAVTATVPVGPYPEGVAIRGGFAYVANWFSDTVSVIDLATLRETRRIPVAEGPRGLAVAPGAPEASR